MVTHNPSVLTRKPFSQVVAEFTDGIELKGLGHGTTSTTSATTKTPHQTVNIQQPLEILQDTRSIEELTQEMKYLANNLQDKLLYACKNGTDDISCQLLHQLLQDEQTDSSSQNRINLTKIVDKHSGACTLMHLLAQRNKPKSMELLFSEYGFTNLDIIDSISATPLIHAVAHNSEDAVAFLLSKGVNVNVRDAYNKFPLSVALKNNHYKMAELLSSYHGIDVHLRGPRGNTALHIMCDEGNLRGVQFLVDKCNASPLRRNNDEEHVMYYSLPHIEISAYLARQISLKGSGLIKMLASANTMGRNTIHKCASDGFFDSLLVVMKNLNLTEFTTSQIESLMNAVDKNGDTPLILAVKNGRTEMVRFLCSCSEVKLNTGDKDKITALSYAVASKDKSLISTLQTAGASLNADKSDDESDIVEKPSRITNCIRSMNTLLLVILSLVTIICIAAIGAVSIGFFSTNIRSNAETIRKKYFSETMTYLRRGAKEQTIIVQTMALHGATGRFNISSSADVLEMTWASFTTNFEDVELMSTLYCGRPDGALAGVFSTIDGYYLLDSYVDPYSIDVYRVPELNKTLSQVLSSTKSVVHRQSVDGNWQLLINRNQPLWAQSQASPFLTEELFVSFQVPFRDPITNAFTGYCAGEISNEYINDFLQRYQSGITSLIAVVARKTGHLIGTSEENIPIFTRVAATNTTAESIIRYDGTNTPNPVFNKMMKHTRSKYDGAHQFSKFRTQSAFSTFTQGGDKYVLNIGSVQDEFGIDWIVVQCVNINTFYKQFYTSVIIMCCMTAGLLIISIIVSYIAARSFMVPILRLISQADHVKNLQIEQVEKELQKLSFFTEIRSLQYSFASMATRLKQFRQFIPDHILSVIEAEIINKSINVHKETPEKLSERDQKSATDSLSDSRGTSVSSNFNRRGMVAHALTSNLSNGVASILAIRLPDFAEILELYPAADISETTRDLLNELKHCIRDSNGQLVSLTSRKVIIVWNSFISQPDHRPRACRTAKSCMNALLKLHAKWKVRNLPLLQLTMGIASGTIHFGNIGSDSTKFFTIMGKPASRANQACRLNDTWKTQIILTEDVQECVNEEFLTRPIDKVDGIYMYELGENKSPDAWAHELPTNNTPTVQTEGDMLTNAMWSMYMKAYRSYEGGQLEEAEQQFSEYLQKYPYDPVGQKMLEMCKEREQELTGESS